MWRNSPSRLIHIMGGTGSLGSVLISRLPPPTTVLLRSSSPTRKVSITITTPGLNYNDSDHQSNIFDVKTPDVGLNGTLVCTLKGYDVEEGLERLVKDWGREGESFSLVVLSNGLLDVYDTLKGNDIVTGRVSPVDCIALGSTTIGATKVRDEGEGEVRSIEVMQTGWGDTIVSGPVWVREGGDVEECEGRVNELVDAMKGAGFPTTKVGEGKDIWTVLWLKLCVNCLINPVATIERTTNEFVPLHLGEGEGSLRDGLVGELVEVGNRDLKERGSSYELDPDVVVANVMTVVSKTKNNRNSMLQDMENGRRTEIDALNGWVVKRGEELGIECVNNRMICKEINKIERT